ncbi:MAG: T-complex protein 1 subunit gamma [Watsoniomyces obsoletus]|nr:MAG: T-complex protein 1 subunit gamma [Watsoniomyces obsoletus]
MSTSPRSREGGFVDPNRPATFPVVLGASLSKSKKSSGRPLYTSVRYNHKPAQTTAGRTAVMKPSRATKKVELRIADQDVDKSTYVYHARNVPKMSYALVFDPAKKAFVLEKVQLGVNCDLIESPWESDAAKLRTQYPQLDEADERRRELEGKGSGEGDSEDDLFSDPDDNPFDHRRFMEVETPSPHIAPTHHRQVARVSPAARPTTTETMTPAVHKAKSPLAQPAPTAKPSVAASPRLPERDDADDEASQVLAPPPPPQPRQRPKPRPRAPPQVLMKPKPRRAPPAQAPPAAPAPVPAAPAKRPRPVEDDDLIIDLDPQPARKRRNSPVSLSSVTAQEAIPTPPQRHHDEMVQEDQSDDGLIIEMEPDTKPKRGLGVSLGRPPSGAPISLRSVASSLSPGDAATIGGQTTQNHDAMASGEHDKHEQQRQRVNDSDVDGELQLPPSVLQPNEEQDDEDDDDDEDEDEDEEDDDDDDDDAALEAQLERALESDIADDEALPPVEQLYQPAPLPPPEPETESEEE